MVGGSETTQGLRSRVVRGRPNWWVILAVSLALMALLVATAGGTRRGSGRPPHRLGSAAASDAHRSSGSGHGGATAPAHHAGAHTASSTTTTAAPVPALPPATGSGSALASVHSGTSGGGAPSGGPVATTTTLPPATTTTTTTIAPSASLPADRTQTQGYLDPPLQTTNSYGFTGTGAMEISVLWSGSTYLTMAVSCPSGSQSVGGTAAMAASLPDASGNCLATVREPASESASLTYTITIGPAGG